MYSMFMNRKSIFGKEGEARGENLLFSLVHGHCMNISNVLFITVFQMYFRTVFASEFHTIVLLHFAFITSDKNKLQAEFM